MNIYVPADLPEVTIKLPSPQMGDGRRREDLVQLKQAMDGSYRTHVKKNQQTTYRWEFVLTRMKGLEVLNFFESFAGEKWKIVWNDTYIGYVKLNPASIEMLRRGVLADSVETVGFAFEFETTSL